jgi:hypothetical protein
MKNATLQVKAEHGDLITIGLHEEAVSKLLELLARHEIQARPVQLEQAGKQVLVPAEYAMQLCEIGYRVVNDDYGDLNTFQGEFLTAVYDSATDSVLDFYDTEFYLPTVYDIQLNKKICNSDKIV